jgi:hypothetical protein
MGATVLRRVSEATPILQFLHNSSASQASVVVGIDPGARKVGLATLRVGRLASALALGAARPLATLRAPTATARAQAEFLVGALAARLRALEPRLRVALLVVGYPLLPDGGAGGAEAGEGAGDAEGLEGSTGEGCRRAEELVGALRAAGVAAPALLWDERGTSAAARAQLRAEGVEEVRARGFGGGSGGGADSAITRALRTRQRAARALPPGVRERVDELAAAALLDSFAEAAMREMGAASGGRLA